ncbi:FAD-dependent oxidoreductase [Nitriliruptoraceae bacterium ZYF776]|nr:FAD-dependent oxidoreductase [Profundirhabdus halotolerans]
MVGADAPRGPRRRRDRASHGRAGVRRRDGTLRGHARRRVATSLDRPEHAARTRSGRGRGSPVPGEPVRPGARVRTPAPREVSSVVRVVVVGAGVAGLTAARSLVDAGLDVVVLDKSHRVGGRLASRSVDGVRFDVGAQFLTAKGPVMRDAVARWEAAGVLGEWFRGSPDLDADDGGDGHPRYRGTPDMRSLPEHLAVGLDVRTATPVTALTADAERWRIEVTARDGAAVPPTLPADALVVTAPVPQALALLDAGGVQLDDEVAGVLRARTYQPCVSVLAVCDRPTALPASGALRRSDPPLWWLTDGRRKGLTDVDAVTLHADPVTSRVRYDDDRLVDDLLAAAQPHLGVRPRPVHVHRWRYAVPDGDGIDGDALATRAPAPLVLAGDAFAGGRIEGAHRSGLAAAAQLRTLVDA